LAIIRFLVVFNAARVRFAEREYNVGVMYPRSRASRSCLDAMASDDISCDAIMTKRDPESLLPLTPAMFYVLVAMADGATHGYAILKDVEQLTGGDVRLSTGTLYGIIKRLLGEGLIRESREDDIRRRSYTLTAFGRDVARAEAARLEQTLAIARKKALFKRPRNA